MSVATSIAVPDRRIGHVDGPDRAPITRAGGQWPQRERGAGAACAVAVAFPAIPGGHAMVATELRRCKHACARGQRATAPPGIRTLCACCALLSARG